MNTNNGDGIDDEDDEKLQTVATFDFGKLELINQYKESWW